MIQLVADPTIWSMWAILCTNLPVRLYLEIYKDNGDSIFHNLMDDCCAVDGSGCLEPKNSSPYDPYWYNKQIELLFQDSSLPTMRFPILLLTLLVVLFLWLPSGPASLWTVLDQPRTPDEQIDRENVTALNLDRATLYPICLRIQVRCVSWIL